MVAVGAAGLESDMSFLVVKLEVYRFPLVGHSSLQQTSKSKQMNVHVRRVNSTRLALDRTPRLTQYRALFTERRHPPVAEG